jgi:WD40 repeat protein
VLWDRERKVEVAAVQAHTSKAECVAFSADGKWVATGGADHKIRIWNRSILEGANRVSSHFARTVAEAEHPIEKVRFLDSGELMVMTGGGSLVTLNSLSNERTTDSLFDLSEPVRAVALSNNGTVAIGYQDKFEVVERHNRDPTPNEFKFSVRIDHLAISRDGQWIAVGGKGSPPVYVVDRRNNGKIIPVPDPTAEAVSVAVSDDGRFAALCSWDKMLRVWDLKRGQLHRELPGHTEWATTLRFSRDGTLLCTGAVDGTLRLFDLQNRREREVLRGHGGGAFVGVFEIAFSPDGELVASAGYDKTIRIWDTLTGQEKVLFLPSASAISLDWNPAGTILSCGCLDRSVHFWVSNHNEMVAMPSRE